MSNVYTPDGVMDFGRFWAFTNDEGHTIEIPFGMITLTDAGLAAERQNSDKRTAELEARRAKFLANGGQDK